MTPGRTGSGKCPARIRGIISTVDRLSCSGPRTGSRARVIPLAGVGAGLLST
jgi:hypothetical protein